MKSRLIYTATICFIFSYLFYGCDSDKVDDRKDAGREKCLSDTIHLDGSMADTGTYRHRELTDVRQPDMKKYVRKGSALLLETDGFVLSAIDTAVLHTATYSVTSLLDEELASLPQDMKNMTSAAAGYRLLPGGEHFSPYAELRVAYNPELLPDGYTPYDIYTSFYDTQSRAWVRLERVEVDTANHEIISLTSHFTDFINELVKVPEMPETQAFVPTAMTDLKAVNPLDGIPLIQPPAANNNGTVDISYPIAIPAGRGGMQPNLALTYSSSGGNGWLGVGWDIPVPNITLDTRWGVPRYDSEKETEIYLLNGVQLITKDTDGFPNPMPHRTNHQLNRMPDETQFYARAGDAHDSIIRHNVTTTDYWWEVVDRQGVTHYYGHYYDSTLDATYPTALKDNHGNIAKWMLAESRDPYGNWVRYFYDVVTSDGVNPGKQIYLNHVKYTGNKEEQGKYAVEFIRKSRNPNDIPVNCSLGLKEVTDQELCYIRIGWDTDSVFDTTNCTGYFFEKELSYESNFKTRLKAVYRTANYAGSMTKWCNGHPINSSYYVCRHEFQYYNTPYPKYLFSNEYNSVIPEDTISAFLLTAEMRADSITSATAMGLTHSSNWSIGGTLGVGTDPNVYETTNSIGGNFHWSESSSESLLMLVDLNGDGLADKVFVKDDSVYWRKQCDSVDSIIRFAKEEGIEGIEHFLQEASETSTWGVQADVVDFAKGSGSWSNTTSTTSTYFADVDGDGLVDLIVDGQVYFNRIVNNKPTFYRYSEAPQEAEPEEYHPSCDSIIFDGEVDTNIACDRIWILAQKDQVFEDSVMAEECAHSYSTDDDHIAIIEQDSSGLFHVFRYYAEMDCSRRNLAGRNVPTTESVRVWVAPEDGNVQIHYAVRLLKDTSVYRQRHADGITYVIQHSSEVIPNDGYSLHSNRDSIIDTIYICDTCWNNEAYYIPNTLSVGVDSGDIILFRLQSMNDRQFDNVMDSVVITMNDMDYSSTSSFILNDNAYFQAPYSGFYSIDTLNTDMDESLSYGLKKNNCSEDTIAQGGKLQLVVTTSDTNADWSNVRIRAKITYWSDSLADTMTVWTAGRKNILHPAGSVWGDTTYQRLFGLLYNGWGQFTYHSRNTNSYLIPLDSLVASRRVLMGDESEEEQDSIRNGIRTQIDDTNFNSPSISVFEDSFGNQFNPLSGSTCWVEMTADAEHNSWVAFGAQNSIGRDTMRNTMQREWYNSTASVASTNDIGLPSPTHYDDVVPPPASDGTPAKAILKVNSTRNQSYTCGAAIVNAAYSHGRSSIETDYLDMNGDRYPDIVGTGYVQYRQQWGGLGDKKGLPHGISDVNTSITNSVGVGFGASPVTHNRNASQNPAKAKFALSADGFNANRDFSVGWDYAPFSWLDVNGDGLPDFVTNDGGVRLNIGYTFLGAEDWDFSSDHALRSGMSASNSASTAFAPQNIAQGSIQLGKGISRSVNRIDHSFMDINGDGLPDLIWRNVLDFDDIERWSDVLDPTDSIHVKYNLGNGLWSDEYDLNIKNFNWSETYNEYLNAGITVGFPVLGFKATVGINGTPYSSSTSRDRMQLVDIDGDGMPDLVTSSNENHIAVKYNRGGKTNLLKKVTNPTGSEINLSYILSAPDCRQPSRTWLLDMVTTHDPLNPNGGDTSVTSFEYHNPNFNRFERISFGYGTVVTKQINPVDGSVYRKIKRDYYNSDIMNRGRILRELTSDGENNKYIEKEYQYDYTSYVGNEPDICTGNAYVNIHRVVTRYFEGAEQPKLTVAETFEYDQYHNVITYIDEGDTSYNNDGLTAVFTYMSNQRHNLIGLRDYYSITPTGSSSPQRVVWFDYDSTGKMTRQMLWSLPSSPVYEFEYDTTYGNLSRAVLPRNDSNHRMEYTYTYDTVVSTYPVLIENSFGESTRTSYNYLFGIPLSVTDKCGNTMTYSYDCTGRLAAVSSPMNTSVLPSVRHFYYSNGAGHQLGNCSYSYSLHSPYFSSSMNHSRPYAVTEHFDDSGDLITRTVVIADGFGRVLQTKKGLTVNGTAGMQVSGSVKMDAFGRTVRQYDAFFVADTALHSLGHLESFIDSSATVSSYDILDRTTMTMRPLGVTTICDYDILNDDSGRRRFYTKTIDPENNITQQYTDYDGRNVQVTDAAGGVTKMCYDNLGQLVSTSDPDNFYTLYEYDIFGRLISRTHPDAGTTMYQYDPAGNVTKETTPLGVISYSYSFNRLAKKQYSYLSGNDVSYSYGNSGNETGRIIRVVDGSGRLECSYDALGNVSYEIRTIALPEDHEVYTFRTKYNYDSWGRVQNMTYPDDEVVSYGYVWGGDLTNMDGTKNNTPQPYIHGIFYNRFGQRDSIQYGNGTRARYIYDSLHRLSHLTSYQNDGTIMQNIEYTYDNASNITHIYDGSSPIGILGGGYANRYKYDVLHRLALSYGNNVLGHYDYYMDYSSSGRIIQKKRHTPSGSISTPAIMYYGYCNEDKPHAVKRIYDEYKEKLFDFRWDGAGNLGQISVAKPKGRFETGRFLFWTEDNRMHTAVDEKYYSYYAYDHSGERRLKLTGDNISLDVNADFMYAFSVLKNITLYPSAYMVLSNHGYTKHYYAGAERVAARVGDGGLDAFGPCISTYPEITEKADSVFHKSLNQIYTRKIEPNMLDCLIDGLYIHDAVCQEITDIPDYLIAKATPDYSEFRNTIHNMTELQNTENEVYFYHSDHLGSASWITDIGGSAIQHLQYLPYGEHFVDQRTSNYHERFTFTGKEKDGETGYGYFGARYMDHELTGMWLGVDRYASKYPSISPYAYCAWNPMRLIDPSGDTVIIKGNQADRAVAQLQTGNMEITRSETGVLSVDLHGKKRSDLSHEERLIYDAINSSRVKIEITAQKTELSGDRHVFIASFDGDKKVYECLYGGSNLGSYYNPSTNKAVSIGLIDMDMFEENGFDQGVPHEVSEYYIAGLIAVRDASNIEIAEQNKRNTRMMEAHNKAIPEVLGEGGIYQFGIKHRQLGKIK